MCVCIIIVYIKHISHHHHHSNRAVIVLLKTVTTWLVGWGDGKKMGFLFLLRAGHQAKGVTHPR